MSNLNLPEAALSRLTIYQRALVELNDSDIKTVSSRELAEITGSNESKVRKDLSYLGSYGTRGVGYETDRLIKEIGVVLGGGQPRPAVLVGIGNLGRALSQYEGFEVSGFPIVGLVDTDPNVVGETINGLKVKRLDQMEELVAQTSAVLGIVTTPSTAAQEVVDCLVKAGIMSILNFAPVVVDVVEEVEVRKVDLATELQILGYYDHLRKFD
ncbi:MAG: redox-sensing transcriptional repressor Rex [Acidimicrobiales bacterium]|nr:redox-sensing transcriptional repressor Rex [Acidimicrobiales bacterium]MDP6894125.1 redox-sensing transcriptional repressor Rex [Acidimicrobiales bacterium]